MILTFSSVLSRAVVAVQTSGCCFHHDLMQETCTLLERTIFSDLGFFQPTNQQYCAKGSEYHNNESVVSDFRNHQQKPAIFTWRISQIERHRHWSLRWEIHKNDHAIQTWTLLLSYGFAFDLLATWRTKGMDYMHESAIGVNDLRNPVPLP